MTWYRCKEYQLLCLLFQKLTEDITRITHTHPHALQGAVLQSCAVHLALNTDKLDTDMFVDNLIEKMKVVEESIQPEKKMATRQSSQGDRFVS